MLVNKIIVTVLMGIKIAAMRGDSSPWTANDKPTTLYSSEMIKLMWITFTPSFACWINCGIF
ncbi:hypothetical protein D3C80_1369350 [compost metagenome]